jgi:hypothetical protein
VPIHLATGNGGKDGFKPQTNVGGGRKGLKKGKGKASTVKLFGKGLVNGLDVEVHHNPGGTLNPKHLWTGTTSGSTGGATQCEVVLRQRLNLRTSGKRITDDDITVSVTVSDTSTGTTSNTTTPRVPSGP